MHSLTKILAVAALMTACGDNKAGPDARIPPMDAYCSNCPAAPMIGAQIDRIGRPAINTALNDLFNADQTAVAEKKNAYNTNSNPATWVASVPSFMKSLAGIDAVDTAYCGNKRCEFGEANAAVGNALVCPEDCPNTGQIGGICGNTVCEDGETNSNCATDCPDANQVGTVPIDGCGNQVSYNDMPGGGGPPTQASYQPLAGLMALDELWVDTTKGNCTNYLAVEFGVVSGLGNTSCGGRALDYDVMDSTITMGTIGIAGFSTDGTFTPAFGDTVPAHTDYLDTFPYLGPPHQ